MIRLALSFICVFSTFCPGYAAEQIRDVKNDAREFFVAVDDAQIFCRAFGSGDPIIIIHGGPGLSQDYLLPYMNKLAEAHQVIFYDQRGCGRSTGILDAQTIQIDRFLSDVEALRKHLGCAKVAVLGHSWGGLLAMRYASFYPQSVSQLILLNATPCCAEEFGLFIEEWQKRMSPYQEFLKAIQESSAFKIGDTAATREYFQTIFRTYCYLPESTDQLDLHMSSAASLRGRQVYEIFRQNFFESPFDFRAQLKQIQAPTLIVHGDHDPIPCAIAQRLHENIAGSEYVLLKNCGHFPYVEVPSDLFDCLQRFLQKKVASDLDRESFQ